MVKVIAAIFLARVRRAIVGFLGRAGTLIMHRQRLTRRCVGNAGSSSAVIWFQLGSNEGPLNRRFFGISGADSTVLRFVNSRMLYR
jgi:hypothetical protein